jgi:Protein of unknown function (DUF4232)
MRRIRASLIAGIVAAIVVPTASIAMGAMQTPPPSCVRSQLGVRSNGTNGGAGTIRGAWVFTNLSNASCSLDGYPTLQMYGKFGRPLPTTTDDILAPGPTNVTLAPGGSGTFLSSYSDVVSGSPRCPSSTVLQITAPNASASHFLPEQLQACDGTVQVSAVEAGVHGP